MKKGKTSRYLKYAIGEIILVVIGILIALQINNWNQDRKDRTSERKLLENIHRDFIQNKIQFDSVKAINYRNLEALNSKIALFPLNQDSFKIKAYFKLPGVQNISFNPYSSSIESVINSNAIQLIQDEELQKYLVSWKDVLVDYQEEEIAYFKFLNEQFYPYLRANIDLTGVNKKVNWSVLSSMKTQNMIIARRNQIKGIIKAIEEEPIENHINAIVRLTAPKDE